MRRRDLTGQTFGRLLALSYKSIGIKGRKRVMWLCKCTCGKLHTVDANCLNKGLIRSCGCLRNETAQARAMLRPYENLFRRCQRAAQQTKRSCKLTYKQFLQFVVVKRCHYCHSPVTFHKIVSRAKSAGYNLDRKDNSKGYSKENCVVCCWKCNRGKSNCFTYKQWRVMTKCFRDSFKLRKELYKHGNTQW
jgi:hypothetical protein